ncbi:hypothetical protein ACFYWN_44670 [Streptomyces sp. NPDC002917]|uniref:hypothetical protein n=1 Tax=Streptomyces sp. NPDC002917 TaxID=3364671 RepID=UPI00369B2C6A
MAGGQLGRDATDFDWACGWTSPERATILDASAAITSHALNTCANCRGEKPLATETVS